MKHVKLVAFQIPERHISTHITCGGLSKIDGFICIEYLDIIVRFICIECLDIIV